MSNKMKTKIELLLAKAEGTDNDHERDAYTAMAQRLMLQWGIEEADLEARGEVKAEDIIEVRHTYRTTYAIAWISFADSVRSGMGNLRLLKAGSKSVHTAYIIGHKTDVENFWLLMNSLEQQATSAMNLWWKTADERQWGLSSREQYKARREFLLAFGRAVGKRLRDQRIEVQAEATPGAALVLVSKQERVDDALTVMYPKLGKSRGMSHGMGGSSAGHAAGMRANLGGKAVGAGSTAGSLR